jgi:hypothetical protein
VTTLAANALLITGCFFMGAGTTASWPGTMTTRLLHSSTATSGDLMEEARPAAGATGTRLFTLNTSGTANPYSVFSLALEPV